MSQEPPDVIYVDPNTPVPMSMYLQDGENIEQGFRGIEKELLDLKRRIHHGMIGLGVLLLLTLSLGGFVLYQRSIIKNQTVAIGNLNSQLHAALTTADENFNTLQKRIEAEEKKSDVQDENTANIARTINDTRKELKLPVLLIVEGDEAK